MKYLDLNGLLYLWTQIKTLVSNAVANKVDKDGNKVLSDNNYTTTEKNKLAGIESGANNYTHPTYTANNSGLYKVTVDEKGHVSEVATVAKSDITSLGIPAQDTTYTVATTSKDGLLSKTDKSKLDSVSSGAQVNVIETVKVNGTALTPTSKAVDVTVPTKLSQLTNDKSFQSKTEVQALINDAVSGITGINFEIVSSLPTTGVTETIYLKSNNGASGNSYDEYIWLASSSKFEKIGTTDIDLTPYLKKSELTSITNAEIDTIIAS